MIQGAAVTEPPKLERQGVFMKIFEVISRFYDNGETESEINEIEAEEIPKDTYRERETCDEYREYFYMRSEAEKWAKETENA